jgi:hypothetical protein
MIPVDRVIKYSKNRGEMQREKRGEKDHAQGHAPTENGANWAWSVAENNI